MLCCPALVRVDSMAGPSDDPDALQEALGFSTMYEGGGALKSDNACLSILAGATVGGGTRINWWGATKPHHARLSKAILGSVCCAVKQKAR